MPPSSRHPQKWHALCLMPKGCLHNLLCRSGGRETPNPLVSTLVARSSQSANPTMRREFFSEFESSNVFSERTRGLLRQPQTRNFLFLGAHLDVGRLGGPVRMINEADEAVRAMSPKPYTRCAPAAYLWLARKIITLVQSQVSTSFSVHLSIWFCVLGL